MSVCAVDRFCHPLEPRRLLAAAYYISPSGNDALDGRSPHTAWRTLARVNGKNWNPGDRILFEGGKTFSAAGGSNTNLLTNAGFESGLTGWSDSMGTTSSATSASTTFGTYRSGSAALQISGTRDGFRAQDVTSKLAPNQMYKMSAWTRSISPGLGDRRVGINFYLRGERVAAYYRGFRGESWAQTQWEFAAPAFDRAVVWVGRYGDDSTFCVDDLSLTPVATGIVLTESDSGTEQYPLIVGSYGGGGRATIDSGDAIGLWGHNLAGIRIQNLNFVGSWDATTGSGNNAGVGVELVNTQSGDTKLEFIRVEKVQARGFQWAGIRIGGWNGKSGFRDVAISDTIARGNGDVGIHLRGNFARSSLGYSNENVVIARCQAFDNSGIPNKGGNSGSGIQISDTNGARIERCVAHYNGALNNYAGGGPFGIWAFDSSRIIIHYNESYANKTNSAKDGGGFDLDGGVTNSRMEYNYSHDNDGPGFLLCQFNGARTWGKNIVRYNISQNDARRNGYGAITISDGSGPGAAVANAVIEHNTVFLSPAASGSPAALKFNGSGAVGLGVQIRHNIFQTTGGATLLHADPAPTAATFTANAYWPSGGAFRIRWGGTTHTGLSSWRSATGKDASALNLDPRLTSPGAAPTLNDARKLTTLTQYALRADSPLKSRCASVTTAYRGYLAASYDFFSRTLTTARETGAVELL